MPIHRLLQRSAFEPQHITVMTTAFEGVCLDLGPAERDDALREIFAKAIITRAQAGEFDPIKLRKCANIALKV